jgi:hypothetical protein
MGVTTAALADAGSRVGRFLFAQTIANTVIGVAIAGGLYFMGIPNAALWGLLAAILRFIPFLGPVIAGIFPTLIAAATQDSWVVPLMVIGWSTLMDVLSANFLEPFLYGAQTGISAIGILFAFVFWAWLWGSIGLLLAAPLTVCLLSMGRHIPGLEFFNTLLGNEPVSGPAIRLYQRLLTKDKREAQQIVERYARTTPLVEVFDDILVPAAARIQADIHAGFVIEPRITAAREILRELTAQAAKLAAKDAPPPADSPLVSDGTIAVALPDCGNFDDLAMPMLATASRLALDQFLVMPCDALAAEVAAAVQEAEPRVVVFLTVEPRRVDRVLLIWKRLQLAGISVPAHAVVLSETARARRHRERLRRVGLTVHSSLVAGGAAVAALAVTEQRPETAPVAPAISAT